MPQLGRGFPNRTRGRVGPVLVVPSDTDAILEPVTDIDVGEGGSRNWTRSSDGGSSNLYVMLWEPVANDISYVLSPPAPTTAEYYELKLQAHADPLSSTGHVVRYRYQASDADAVANLTVKLFCGSTEIASWTHSAISTTWTTANQTLSSGEADAITDYTDLRLRFIPSLS